MEKQTHNDIIDAQRDRIEQLEVELAQSRHKVADVTEYCRKLQDAINEGHPVEKTYVDPFQSLQLQREQSRQREARLEAALLDAKPAVEWMAEATDSDPEDHERLEIVEQSLKEE